MAQDPDVVLAESAGFCPGVKQALARVLALAQSGKSPIYTLGPLVHNTEVIRMLEEKGIRAVESLAEVNGKDGVIVIRAHGITPGLESELRARGLEVVDATCPLVKKVHRAIRKYTALGYATVIVGDQGHAEVVGLVGCAGGKAQVVAGPDAAARLPRFDRVHIVAQTTQEEDVFLKTVAAIRKRSREAAVSDTICQPSRDRQHETRELAGQVDLMVVVGGRRSANTARLAELCRRLCPATALVEAADELDPAAVRAARRVGVTAGASTPEASVQSVAQRIRALRAA